MVTREERVRADIATKFGSIPKMAREIGIAQNTIYHALERGLDNTTSKTRSAILDALYGRADCAIVKIWTDEEEELVELFRKLHPNAQRAIIAGLREYVG